MKKVKLTLSTFALIAFAFVFTSCEKEVDSNNPQPTTSQNSGNNGSSTNDFFYAKLNGTEFQETSLQAQELFVDEITITASLGFLGAAIQVVVPIDIMPGSYTFNQFVAPEGYYTTSLGSQDVYSTEDGVGNLTITTNDQVNQEIVGTFNFVATPIANNPSTDTHTITEGAFSVTY